MARHQHLPVAVHKTLLSRPIFIYNTPEYKGTTHKTSLGTNLLICLKRSIESNFKQKCLQLLTVFHCPYKIPTHFGAAHSLAV